MGYYDGIDIQEVLFNLGEKHQIKITQSGNEVDFYYCPNCKTHQIDFNIDKAIYKCHRCGASGTFLTLYDSLEGTNAFFNRFKHQNNRPAIDLEALNQSLTNNLFAKKNTSLKARAYLENRGIDADVAFYQQLGYADEKFLIPGLKEKHYHLKNTITFPVFNKEKRIINIRFKQVQGITPEQYYKGNVFNIKGCGNLETNYIYIPEIESPDKRPSERLWIFEGEPDAVLVFRLLQNYAEPDFFYSTKIITGTAGANSIPKEWNEEFFDLPTTIFYDSDRQGKAGADKINAISPNIKIANLEYAFDEKDKDITDLWKNIGDKRTAKYLKLLEMLAINKNNNAVFTNELNQLKEQLNRYFSISL